MRKSKRMQIFLHKFFEKWKQIPEPTMYRNFKNTYRLTAWS